MRYIVRETEQENYQINKLLQEIASRQPNKLGLNEHKLNYIAIKTIKTLQQKGQKNIDYDKLATRIIVKCMKTKLHNYRTKIND